MKKTIATIVKVAVFVAALSSASAFAEDFCADGVCYDQNKVSNGLCVVGTNEESGKMLFSRCQNFETGDQDICVNGDKGWKCDHLEM